LLIRYKAGPFIEASRILVGLFNTREPNGMPIGQKVAIVVYNGPENSHLVVRKGVYSQNGKAYAELVQVVDQMMDKLVKKTERMAE